MVIHYQKPIFELEHYIDHLWEKSVVDISDIPYEIETIFPEDQLNITFTLGLPYLRAQKNPSVFEKIDTHVVEALHTIPSYYKHQIGNHIFGIKFKIGGLYPFVATTFKDFVNTTVPISSLIKIESDLINKISEADQFEKRCTIFQEFLLQLLNPKRKIKLERLNTYISSDIEFGNLSESEYKALMRLFIDISGITPKEYVQIRRINQSLAQLSQKKEIKSHELADMLGFYDSAHFTNEFKKFTGKTPKVYKDEISSTESNQIVQEFRQYISPEHLLFYTSKVHDKKI
jgi:AraC-like DNA-binding protein